MTFVKSILATAVITGASFNASAATFNLGDVTGQSGFGASNNGVGMFDDTINFSLTAAQNISAILFNFSFDMPQNVIGGFTATLSYEGSVIDSMVITDNVVSDSINASAGNYSINLVGDFGDAYGTYNVGASIAPVPEPSTLGLMFGGMGLVGLMAYRARKA